MIDSCKLIANTSHCISRRWSASYQRDVQPRLKTGLLRDWRDAAAQMPQSGEETLLVTTGQFAAWHWLEILTGNVAGERLILSTFNISAEALECIEELLASDRIVTATIIVNEAVQRLDNWAANGGRTMHWMREKFPGRIRMHLGLVHAKIIGIATSDGRFWVVEGSGNMAENRNVEIYSVRDDRARYMFHARWIENQFRQ